MLKSALRWCVTHAVQPSQATAVLNPQNRQRRLHSKETSSRNQPKRSSREGPFVGFRPFVPRHAVCRQRRSPWLFRAYQQIGVHEETDEKENDAGRRKVAYRRTETVAVAERLTSTNRDNRQEAAQRRKR